VEIAPRENEDWSPFYFAIPEAHRSTLAQCYARNGTAHNPARPSENATLPTGKLSADRLWRIMRVRHAVTPFRSAYFYATRLPGVLAFGVVGHHQEVVVFERASEPMIDLSIQALAGVIADRWRV
jgi:hypothetical protein